MAGYRDLVESSQQGYKKYTSHTEAFITLVAKNDLAQAVKVLKELHEQQAIAGKASGDNPLCHCRAQLTLVVCVGKQIVYHAVQDPKDSASLEDLAQMDREMETLRESIATAKANEKLLKASLATVNATLSSENLRARIITLEQEQKELLARLGPLRTGSVRPVSHDEKEEAEKAWRQWSKKAASRKKFCMEMWCFCTQELPEDQTKEELWVREIYVH